MKHIDLSNDPFCKELAKYNKVHRLIGNVSCETLLRESLAAIEASKKECSAYSTMVDVGAGSGVLGYAWILSGQDRRTVFLEPDKKAVAFLHMFFSTYKNTRVVHKRLEDLKSEEVLSLEPDKGKAFLAARAFSSSMSLEDAYKKSQLDMPLFNFEKTDTSYSLARII